MTANLTWKQWWPAMYAATEQPTEYPGGSESYIYAGQYLKGDGLVEEWGCATTFGKQFIPAPYRGVDGAPSGFNDITADLSTYSSAVPNALMRHVLEHNWNWRVILDNFLSSFTVKGVLILFIPPGKFDVNRSFEHRAGEPPSPPGLQLDRDSLNALLSRPGLELYSAPEILKNDTPPFGYEEIFYLRKITHSVPWTSRYPRCVVCEDEGWEQLRIDISDSQNRFEYQVPVCKKHQSSVMSDLYSLKLPVVEFTRDDGEQE